LFGDDFAYGRATTASDRCDICLMVVIVANIRAAQNAPINAENIKRESTTGLQFHFLESPITAVSFKGCQPPNLSRGSTVRQAGAIALALRLRLDAMRGRR
jgi:hypothetical protein